MPPNTDLRSLCLIFFPLSGFLELDVYSCFLVTSTSINTAFTHSIYIMPTLKSLLSSLRSPFLSTRPSPSIHFFFLTFKSRHGVSTAEEEKEEDRLGRQNAVTDFLLKECGISESQLSTVKRRTPALFMTTSTQRAQEAIDLLRDSGLTPHQVRRTIVKVPSIVTLKVDKQLKPKIELIKSLGLTEHELGRAIAKNPRILASSLDKKFNISSLEKLCGSRANLCKVVKETPSILAFDFDKQIKPRLNTLKQVGIEGELLSYFMVKRPYVLLLAEASLKLKLEYIRKMGFLEGSKRFVIALSAVGVTGVEMLEKKREHMTSIGLQEDEVKEIFRKFPVLLNCSMDKIQKNMDFLVHMAGFQPTIVVLYPILLAFSLEKRIRPRYRVLESLSLPQLDQEFKLRAFLMAEKDFVRRFLNDNPQH